MTPSDVELMPDLALLETFYGSDSDAILKSHAGSLGEIVAQARIGDGVDFGTYALGCAFELMRRARLERMHRDFLGGPQAVREWLVHHFFGRDYESFVAIALDSMNHFRGCAELFTGTLTTTSVHPREVVKYALRTKAAALLIAHCHPSGYGEPSEADKALTRHLKKALDLVDVRLLDHFIVAGDGMTSLAERGLI